jgi:hypothetical protein
LQAVNRHYAGDAAEQAVTRAEEVRTEGTVAAIVIQGIAQLAVYRSQVVCSACCCVRRG